MQKWTMLMITKSQKGKQDKIQFWWQWDHNVWHFVTTCHLTPACWSSCFPPGSSGSPCLVSGPEGEKEVVPTRGPFSQKNFWTKSVFAFFDSFGYWGIVEGMPCRRIAAPFLFFLSSFIWIALASAKDSGVQMSTHICCLNRIYKLLH